MPGSGEKRSFTGILFYDMDFAIHLIPGHFSPHAHEMSRCPRSISRIQRVHDLPSCAAHLQGTVDQSFLLQGRCHNSANTPPAHQFNRHSWKWELRNGTGTCLKAAALTWLLLASAAMFCWAVTPIGITAEAGARLVMAWNLASSFRSLLFKSSPHQWPCGGGAQNQIGRYPRPVWYLLSYLDPVPEAAPHRTKRAGRWCPDLGFPS